MTVAAFMEVALYDPDAGYYSSVARRTGRCGDFFTSVDVGPLFGDLLEVQLAEMWEVLKREHPLTSFDLVEAGAGDGRLAADILKSARRRDGDFHDSVRLTLVEASERARLAQRSTLGEDTERLSASGTALPDAIEGVVLANELLDALPTHQVVMRPGGLREVYVVNTPDGRISLEEGPLSSPALSRYLENAGVVLEAGWRAEINLRAVTWVADAARRLKRGYLLLIDYGHEAQDLYSVAHSSGTLTSFATHVGTGGESTEATWLHDPGERDITAHVDFTSIRAAAEAEGLRTIALMDQTYFLLGLLDRTKRQDRAGELKTLVMPGGLGSTHKVLIMSKGITSPTLRGCSFATRLT